LSPNLCQDLPGARPVSKAGERADMLAARRRRAAMFGQEADPRPGGKISPLNGAPPPDYEQLAAPFRPIFADIAAGAVEREREGQLPYAEVERLRGAGFGRLRIPRAAGGMGATIPQLFRL